MRFYSTRLHSFPRNQSDGQKWPSDGMPIIHKSGAYFRATRLKAGTTNGFACSSAFRRPWRTHAVNSKLLRFRCMVLVLVYFCCEKVCFSGFG